MMPIKTKEFASLLVAAVAAIVVAAAMWLLEAVWWQTLSAACAVFVGMTLLTLFIIRKYVAYKLKPIYSIVLSRNVHTQEILDELKDKHVENISEELTAWADTNDKEIARLKETESFRKQYLGNVAHELKTPIFNIQGYISTLLDGGLEDDLINRKYLERAEKSIDRLIDIVNDLDTISKLESNMTRLKMESFDIAAMTREIAEQAEIEADKKGIKIQVRGADSLPSPFLGLCRQAFRRTGVGQSDYQLDPLWQGGGCNADQIPEICWIRSSSKSRTTASVSPRRTCPVFSSGFTVRTRAVHASRAVRGSDWRSSSILSKLTASESTSAASWEWERPSVYAQKAQTGHSH